ncbi:cache domain-containing protein [Candidatus Leptofilum sp.]|uniref:cache domain-containing protein n=1 Tax=Candidatus Leptofilum sp. TaxID=3241576 RepID=UPI003B5BB70E
MFKLNHISSRLRLTYILLAILPLLIAGSILLWVNFNALNEQAQLLQEELARRVTVEIEAYFSNLEETIKVTLAATDLEQQSNEEQAEILNELRIQQPAFQDIYLVGRDGEEIIHSSLLAINTETNLSSRVGKPEFEIPVQERMTYFGPVINRSEINQVPQMIMSTPLEDRRTGEIEYVLVADVSFKAIGELIADVDFGDGEDVYLIDKNGEIIAHRDQSVVLKGNTFSLPAQSWAMGLAGNSAIIKSQTIQLGEQTLTVVAEKELSEALRLAFTTVYIILGILLASLIISIVLSLIATNRLVKPIQQMAGVARRVQDGDLTPKARESGLSELDELAGAFNSMTSQLREMLTNLENLVAERTQALRSSADISRYLSTILEVDLLLSEVVHRLHHEMNYGLAEIYQTKGSQSDLILVASSAQNGPIVPEEEQPPQEVIFRAAETNSPIHLPNVLEYERDIQPIEFQSLLAIPIARATQVLGILAVYKRNPNELDTGDLDLVQSVANQLVIALQNAQSFEQLLQEKVEAARQREVAQSQLLAYRNSPLGRADLLAQELLEEPKQTAVSLYKLSQEAERDQERADLLANLPRAMSNRTARNNFEGSESPRLSINSAIQLAEGFHFLQSSQERPELLSVGLRQILAALKTPEAQEWEESASVTAVLQLCHQLISASNVEQLTTIDGTTLPEKFAASPAKLLISEMKELSPVMASLNAYERVDTVEDKISYLVAAVQQWQRVERQARQKLQGIDRILLARIGEKGINIVNGALSDLQLNAQIVCELLTRHTWQNEIVPLTLIIRNQGRGAAFNVRISLVESPNYTIVSENAVLDRIGAGEEVRVTLNVHPRLEQNIREFRARFLVLFTDPRAGEQVENYADLVHLLDRSEPFQHIKNPYIVGTPLEEGSSLFFGREDLVEAIKESFSGEHHHNLVLVGQRRMGKTSLLKQLPFHFSDDYLIVYLDGQVMGLDPGSGAFFLNLATEITYAMEDKGLEVTQPDLEMFSNNPARVFEHEFLPKVMTILGDGHLLILFDEFEELENTVKRGYLDEAIFGYLRHLMQHVPRLSFIFCGTHRLEELSADYWSVFFNITLNQQVGNLSYQDTIRLIQEPVAPYGMRYDDLVLDKIWRLTSGHPYFLQLLCHSLVNQHNRTERSYATISDVNNVLDEILSSGEAHFIYLWTESEPNERMVLFALSRIMPLTGTASDIDLADYLAERGVTLSRAQIRTGLHQLALRDILQTTNYAGSKETVIYRWQLGLIGLWVEKYKSFSRVMDEAFG